MSSVWWKQFNIVVLALALGGFELLRGGRTHRGAALIGLSIAIKPLVILLPFVLLVRRQTRRAGELVLGWAVALNIAVQALIALRAHDPGVISPCSALHNFVVKAKPENIPLSVMLSPLAWSHYQIVLAPLLCCCWCASLAREPASARGQLSPSHSCSRR
jgi:hypothetical protein